MAVYRLNDLGTAAEIIPQLYLALESARLSPGPLEPRRIGVAEAIDGLGRVADHEQPAVEGHRLDDLALHRAGVLILIHQNFLKAPANPASHIGPGTQHATRRLFQILEIQGRKTLLALAVRPVEFA